MHDEATAHYIDMIDQTTLGHWYLKQQFNVTPRIGWQIDPFGHSAVQAYLLGAEVWLYKQFAYSKSLHFSTLPFLSTGSFFFAQLGFDSLYFARIDYQDRAKRKVDKTLEVVWQGSKTFGFSAQVTGLLFTT